MRMWGVSPKILCDQHLLGEHVECHMFAGSLNKGINLTGYINDGLVDLSLLTKRHDILAGELNERFGNSSHKSPLNIKEGVQLVGGKLNLASNVLELKKRCPKCRERMKNAAANYK